MNSPLNAPHATPVSRPSSTASSSGTPLVEAKPITTETSASDAPTERSIPPVTITSVIPSAISPGST